MANPLLKADLKGYVGIPSTDTTQDSLLDDLLEATWNEMREYTGRKLESVSQTFRRIWPGKVVVLPDYPVASITSVDVDGTTLDSTDYDLLDNGVLLLTEVSKDAEPDWIKVVFVGGISWTVAGSESAGGNFPQDLYWSGIEYGAWLYNVRKDAASRLGVTNVSQPSGASLGFEGNGIPRKVTAVWDKYRRRV